MRKLLLNIYEQLHAFNCAFSPIPIMDLTSNSLTICLLNDSEMIKSGALCLIEMQLMKLLYNECLMCLMLAWIMTGKFEIIAFLSRDIVTVTREYKCPGLSIVTVKNNFNGSEKALSIGIVYSSHPFNILAFCSSLSTIVISFDLKMLLGDFNIGYFDSFRDFSTIFADQVLIYKT